MSKPFDQETHEQLQANRESREEGIKQRESRQQQLMRQGQELLKQVFADNAVKPLPPRKFDLGTQPQFLETKHEDEVKQPEPSEAIKKALLDAHRYFTKGKKSFREALKAYKDKKIHEFEADKNAAYLWSDLSLLVMGPGLERIKRLYAQKSNEATKDFFVAQRAYQVFDVVYNLVEVYARLQFHGQCFNEMPTRIQKMYDLARMVFERQGITAYDKYISSTPELNQYFADKKGVLSKYLDNPPILTKTQKEELATYIKFELLDVFPPTLLKKDPRARAMLIASSSKRAAIKSDDMRLLPERTSSDSYGAASALELSVFHETKASQTSYDGYQVLEQGEREDAKHQQQLAKITTKKPSPPQGVVVTLENATETQVALAPQYNLNPTYIQGWWPSLLAIVQSEDTTLGMILARVAEERERRRESCETIQQNQQDRSQWVSSEQASQVTEAIKKIDIAGVAGYYRALLKPITQVDPETGKVFMKPRTYNPVQRYVVSIGNAFLGSTPKDEPAINTIQETGFISGLTEGIEDEKLQNGVRSKVYLDLLTTHVIDVLQSEVSLVSMNIPFEPEVNGIKQKTTLFLVMNEEYNVMHFLLETTTDPEESNIIKEWLWNIRNLVCGILGRKGSPYDGFSKDEVEKGLSQRFKLQYRLLSATLDYISDLLIQPSLQKIALTLKEYSDATIIGNKQDKGLTGIGQQTPSRIEDVNRMTHLLYRVAIGEIPEADLIKTIKELSALRKKQLTWGTSSTLYTALNEVVSQIEKGEIPSLSQQPPERNEMASSFRPRNR